MVEKLKNDDPKKSQSQPLSKRVKILTTSAILFGNLTFGCSFNAFSPALDNMRSKYQTTIDDISVIYTISTILYCFGAIASGAISKFMNRQVIAIVSLMGMAMSMYMTPYCSTKIMFFVTSGLLGLSTGMYDSSQMVWMIEIWQHKSGPFIQAQHFSYALGTIIPTLIVAPFLTKHDHANIMTTASSHIETSSIQIPFLILGTLNALAVLFQMFLFTFYRYHSPPMYANENFELIDDVKNIPTPIENGNISIDQKETFSVFGISERKLKLVAFTVLFLGAYSAMEVSTLQFLPIFGQYSNLKMSEAASAYVLTGLLVWFAAGRLIGIIVISKVKPELIIVTNFLAIIAGNLVLLVWANDSLTMFWIGSMIIGTGYSTMYPSFFAFIEKYLVFNSSIATCILVFAATVSAIYPIIVGTFIEQQAVVLTYTNFFSTSVCVVAMLWGYNLTRKSVNRER